MTYQDDRSQEADPYVKRAEVAQIDGVRGLKLTVSRPKFNELAIVPFHRRLEGRDRFAGVNLERGPINPGIGTDGKLTTLQGGAKNDVCFAVLEAATGLLVPGVQVQARNPSGESVNTRLNNTPVGGPTNASGSGATRGRSRRRGRTGSRSSSTAQTASTRRATSTSAPLRVAVRPS